MKNLLFIIFTLLLISSCSEEIEFEDKYPNTKYLEIKFCSFVENSSVSDLSADLKEISNLNDSYLKEKSLLSFYLDPLFETETYDFIWLNIFNSKFRFLEYEINFKNKKRFINWTENFNKKVSCNNENKQLFYSVFENNVVLESTVKAKKNINFCKYLPNVNLYDLKIYFNDDLSSLSQIKILIPESINDNFDFVIEENSSENSDNLSAASQMGFLANCNEEISDSFLDGLNFDSYPIYSSY